jgi:hypothetical protein
MNRLGGIFRRFLIKFFLKPKRSDIHVLGTDYYLMTAFEYEIFKDVIERSAHRRFLVEQGTFRKKKRDKK